MAMVWAARMKGTRGFQKIVAVKTMLPKLSEDAAFEQMFLDEAALASQVRHPHVVEILDLGEHDGVLYLVMEWINGVPLNQVIKAARGAGGVPLPVAVRICMQACAGLHAAHELTDPSGQLVGLVHRDVSPQNLLVTYDGVTKVVDFGVAKATAVGGGATQAGQVKGKIAYMAPEQIKGHTIDRRIDVFAMGVVLYALTTGKHPFRKESDAATLYQICAPDPPPSPRRIIPGFPVALERVVMQSLAKNPARRFPTANDFLRALDQALPATMRASTDDEVAKFVQSLFAEKYEQQKAALASALARADEIVNESKVKLREYLDSQPPPSRGSISNSGVSEVSLLTEAHAADQTSASHAGIVPSDLLAPQTAGTSSGTGVEMTEFSPPKKRKLGLIVGGAVLGVAAVIGIAVALSGGADSSAATAPTASATPVAATPKPTAEKPKETATAETLPAEPAPSASVEAAEIPPPEEKPKPVVAKPHVRPQPGATKPEPKPKPTAAPPTNWKHDPGF